MRKAIIGGLTALAIGVGTLLGAGTASATPSAELNYLQALNNRGILIYNSDWAVARGYEICNMLLYEDGNAASRELYYNTTWTETPNLYTAQTMVNAAANTLCPWAWAGGSVPACTLDERS